MCVCTYSHTHTHTHTDRLHVHVHVHVHTCIHCIHADTCNYEPILHTSTHPSPPLPIHPPGIKCTYICTCTCTCTVCASTHTHVHCIHTLTHTLTHAHTHTHTHTHSRTRCYDRKGGCGILRQTYAGNAPIKRLLQVR